MYQPQRVRQGWVKIHRRPNGKYVFTGINVLGRDRLGAMVNRLLWADHRSPDWFKTLCDEYADTNFQVEMRVTKLWHTGVALVEPVALSKEQAMHDYQARYGLMPPLDPQNPPKKPDDQQIAETAYGHAFKAHHHAASLLELEVIEDIREGLMSRTHVIDKNGKPKIIIGGMLVNKIVKGYKPEDEQWQRALRAFVRVKDVK